MELRKLAIIMIFTCSLCSIPIAESVTKSKEKLMTLNDAIYLALRYNPSIQNAEIQRVVDKFQLYTTQNEYEVQYALTGNSILGTTRSAGESNSTRSTTVTAEMDKLGIYGTRYNATMVNALNKGIYSPTLSFSVTQPLLQGFGKEVTLANYYSAQEQELNARLSLKDTIQQTVLTTINDYRQIITDQYSVVTAQLSLDSLGKAIQNDQALIKAGEKAPTEILTAQSSYANEQVSLEQAKNSVITDKLDLLNFIGLSPDLLFRVPDDVAVEEEKLPTIEEAIDIAMNNNTQYLQFLINYQTTRRQLLLALDNSRAQLDLAVTGSAGGGNGIGSLTDNQNTSLQAELSLTIPINDYSAQQQIVQSKAALETAEIDLEFAKRDLKTTILNDIINVKSQWASVKMAQLALELQTKNQEYLNSKLKYGLTSTFEVTQQQENLNQYRATLISSKIGYLNSLSQLYSDMGILLDKWNIKVIY